MEQCSGFATAQQSAVAVGHRNHMLHPPLTVWFLSPKHPAIVSETFPTAVFTDGHILS
jgi:hypothetical protein